MKSHLPFLIIIFILSLFFTRGYLLPGIPKTDDANSMVIRAHAFHQSIKDGHFPVRWTQQLNENYGYPVFNFLYPLPFYLAEIGNLTFTDTLTSVKLVYIFSIVFAGFGAYFFATTFTSKKFATLISIYFISSPYVFIDLYQRGSIGEVLALAIIPTIFYFISRYRHSPTIFHQVIIAVLWALLITAHNTTAFLISPVILISIFINSSHHSQKDKIFSVLTITLTALFLSAFFWLPAIYDLQYTRSSSIQISNVLEHFQTPLNIFAITSLAGILIYLFSLYILKTPSDLIFTLIFSISIFFQLKTSYFLWSLLSLDKFVQFPIRFQSLTLSLSLLLVSLLFSSKQFVHPKLLGFALFSSIVFSLFSFNHFQLESLTNSFFETNFDSTTNQKEFTPKQVIENPQTYARLPFDIQGREDAYMINETINKTQEKFVQLTLEDQVKISFNTHFFPGWNLYIDGNRVTPEIDTSGRVSANLLVPERRDKKVDVKLLWEETPLRSLANRISLLSTLLVSFYLIYQFSHHNLKKTFSILALLILSLNLITAIWNRSQELSQVFDPISMEKRYQESQWVNPDSKYPLGDHGLYSWAGWAYIHGTNPILINSEMPPLGKYLIGFGLILTKRPALVGLSFSLFFLFSLYLLSYQIIKHRGLALIPVTLYSTETIFTNSIVFTMLDHLQIGFVCFSFLFLFKAKIRSIWLIPAAISIGGVLATKFYAGGLLFILSIICYYIFTKQIRFLRTFLLALPLAFFVHLLSYTQFFLLGNTFIDYLKVQKYIYHFYQIGAPSVPFASYWQLVLFNRWRVWWGPRWGEYFTLPTVEWSPTWPLAVIFLLFSIYSYLRTIIHLFFHKTKTIIKLDYHLITSWLIFYSLFLTTIGGWPHYMGLFLPFVYILLTQFIHLHSRPVITIINKKVKKIFNHD